MRFLHRAMITLVVFTPALVLADSADIAATFDRWNYPFNVTAGSRLTGSTFGAVPNPQFDDHDAQIIVGFNTADAGVPTNAPIDVTSLVVELTVATDHAFEHDPTYDSFASYLDPAADTDAGRPVEIYGVGLRNGFIFPAFGPTTPGPIAFEEGSGVVPRSSSCSL